MSATPGAVPPIGDSGSVPPSQTPPPANPINYASAGGQIEMVPEARTFGMLCHLSALAGFVIPCGHIVGPLVFWLIKKDQYPFVDDQGKESLNFQITITIAAAVSFALVFAFIGVVLLPAVAIAALVMVIIASVAANGGTYYRYPWTLRLIR